MSNVRMNLREDNTIYLEMRDLIPAVEGVEEVKAVPATPAVPATETKICRQAVPAVPAVVGVPAVPASEVWNELDIAETTTVLSENSVVHRAFVKMKKQIKADVLFQADEVRQTIYRIR